MKFLYFCHNDGSDAKFTGKFIAYVNRCAYELKVPDVDDPLYIVPTKNGDFCYTYKETDIKYDIDVEIGRVEGYKRMPEYTPIEKDGGEHLTVGLEQGNTFKDKDKEYSLLNTHWTSYKERSTRLGDILRQAIGCTIKLDPNARLEEPNEKTRFVVSGFQGGRLGDIYSFNPQLNLIKIIRHLYHIILGNSVTGGKRRKCVPKVHVGARGGRYIIKNNKKMYLKQRGGAYPWLNSDSLSYKDEFINFLSSHLIENVHKTHPDLLDTVLVDDDTSDYFMILYIYGDEDTTVTAQKFAIPKEAVLDMYAKYIAVMAIKQASASASASDTSEPLPVVGNLLDSSIIVSA
jgi:hypothetical protein